MANPWKERVLAYNKRRAQADEMAKDLLALLDALPPGQVKLSLSGSYGIFSTRYISFLNFRVLFTS